MKFKLIFGLMLMFLLPLVFAQDQMVPATFKLVAPQTAIAGMPFSVILQVNSGGVGYGSYDLTISNVNNNAKLTTGYSRFGLNRAAYGLADPFNILPTTGTTQSSYRISAIQKDVASSSTSLKNLFSLDAVVISKAGQKDSFKVADSPRVFGSAVSGKAFTIRSDETISSNIVSLEVEAKPSICGDNVVGYIDANTNGEFDADEQPEKCDVGDANSPACVQCKYINSKAYKLKDGANCNFGSYNTCILDPKNSMDVLKDRIASLLSGSCYPSATEFPTDQKDYCINGVAQLSYQNGILNGGLSKKVYLISQISVALKEYFNSVPTQ